ncbi:bifunctional phosphoribosylaminoimidazolecarboxamide formyltransferase/IMP cyclohydrolase [bacterium]|nr:bifunctional phosphoribosylaminoimidazolecarboxamide formyltransferase/IMP cyclohydrolase [bacterium]
MTGKKRALISVSDKRYVTTFARDLARLGYEIYSTGGTFLKIKEADVPVKELSKSIKSPEILGGRVKTIHPAVFGGILADPNNEDHVKDMKKAGIKSFDMVVVNFYPFHEKVKAGVTKLAEAIELIDIGGPSMVRAAAKNHRNVVIVSDIEQYREVVRYIKDHGDVSEEYRLKLARDAFKKTYEYEAAIAAYFEETAPVGLSDASEDMTVELPSEMFEDRITLTLKKSEKLRYGENPHQQAARYSMTGIPSLPFKVHQGKDMSYNNYLDAASAVSVVAGNFSKPFAACVVKHTNPCGIAIGDNAVKTYINAREADAKSAFGGIVSLNCEVDKALAEELKRTFLEVIIAPSYTKDALETLKQKKNWRLLEVDLDLVRSVRQQSPKVNINIFGALLQDYDNVEEKWENLDLVSQTKPDDDLREDILFGLNIIRHLKSNSLCVVKDGVMIGAGLGQMSRVDAAEIAIKNAGKDCKGAVLVSDGFFPFADSIEMAAKAKFGCVVAPGGSKRDVEVVAMANQLKVPLIFAPNRHFLH